VTPNANEIAAVRWLSTRQLDDELATRPERYTPWLDLEWRRLRADYVGQPGSLLYSP
jgi:isopentenyl-diphosphate delta-isomerase